MARMRQQMTKLYISPFLYFAGLIPTVVGVVIALSLMDYGGFLYRYVEPLYQYDAITPNVNELGMAVILVVGVLVFWLSGWLLILIEKLERPTLLDHLRHCSCFYVLFAILAAMLVPDYLKAYQLPGYPPPEDGVQIIWLLAGCAILVDALVLVWQRLSLDVANVRSIT